MELDLIAATRNSQLKLPRPSVSEWKIFYLYTKGAFSARRWKKHIPCVFFMGNSGSILASSELKEFRRPIMRIKIKYVYCNQLQYVRIITSLFYWARVTNTSHFLHKMVTKKEECRRSAVFAGNKKRTP